MKLPWLPLPLCLLALAAALPPAAAARTAETASAAESAMVRYAEPLRHATATYVVDARLQALAALADRPANAAVDTPAGASDDVVADAPTSATVSAPAASESADSDDDDADAPGAPLTLLAGSLHAKNALLLQTLEADVQSAERASASPDMSADARARAVRKVQADLARARAALIAPDVARAPAFRAAVLAQLLVSDAGVGDAYENAAREGQSGAYQTARALLRQAHALWPDLRPELEPEDQAEVERALGELDALMPSPTPPERLRDPEDAEHAALDIVFALERGLRQPLLLRDFKPALDLASAQAGAACSARRDGAATLAREYALAARATYQAQVAATVGTLAPDVAADIGAAWPAINTTAAGDEADRACATLQSAFTQARKTLE